MPEVTTEMARCRKPGSRLGPVKYPLGSRVGFQISGGVAAQQPPCVYWLVKSCRRGPQVMAHGSVLGAKVWEVQPVEAESDLTELPCASALTTHPSTQTGHR